MSQGSEIIFGVAFLRKVGDGKKRSLCCFVCMFLSVFRLFLTWICKVKLSTGWNRDCKHLQGEATALSQAALPCYRCRLLGASWTDTTHCCSWTQVILANMELWKEEIKYSGVPLCSEMPSQHADVIAITHAWSYACYLSNGWRNVKFESLTFPGINNGFHRNGILLGFKSMVEKIFKCI